jgi:uncharacterized protein (TIGR03083 family)
VSTARLFSPLHRQLIGLLRGLDPSAWSLPTGAGDWTVRQVAAHLLHGDLRRLSGRDADTPGATRELDFAELVGLIDADNARGVEFLSTLSTRVITDLLEVTGRDVAGRFANLPPDAPARSNVAWAGESVSANWADVAREFTERLHHQAQIRDAVGAPPLADPRFVAATLRISVLALRRSFAPISAKPGTSVVVRVSGAFSHAWSVVRTASGWGLYDGAAARPAAEVEMDADTAWRLFFGYFPGGDVGSLAEVRGDQALAEPVLATRSVMIREAVGIGR